MVQVRRRGLMLRKRQTGPLQQQAPVPVPVRVRERARAQASEQPVLLQHAWAAEQGHWRRDLHHLQTWQTDQLLLARAHVLAMTTVSDERAAEAARALRTPERPGQRDQKWQTDPALQH
jgi:hypothetical protein